MPTLAEQLENVLQEQGTTIAPGTLSPVSVGTNQLSWSDTFDRIQQGKQLKPGEGLPTVPQGVPASTFYRQATQLGALPSGASQFFVKPLAPEPPTYDYTKTTTPTTPTTPATTSSTQQQVRRTFQKVQEEQLGDDSFGDTLYDYTQPVEEFDIGAKLQDFVTSINPFADPNVDEFGAIREMSPEEKAEAISKIPSASRIADPDLYITDKGGTLLYTNQDYFKQDKIIVDKWEGSFLERISGNPSDVGVTIREDNFEDSVKKVYDTLTSPFEKAGEYVTEEWEKIKNDPWTTIGAFGVSSFIKAITNSTPLGMMGSFIFKQLLDDDSSFAQSQIGRSGIVNGTSVPDPEGNYNPQSTTIAGYNSLGMAIDKDGNLVLIDHMYAWDSFGSFLRSFGMSDKEARATTQRDKANFTGIFASLQDPFSADTTKDWGKSFLDDHRVEFSQQDKERIDAAIEANKQANKQAFESSSGSGDGVGDPAGMGDQSYSDGGGYGWT